VTITDKKCTVYSINLLGTEYEEHTFDIINEQGVNSLINPTIKRLFSASKNLHEFKDNEESEISNISRKHLINYIRIMDEKTEWDGVVADDISVEGEMIKCFDVSIINFNRLQTGVKKFFLHGSNINLRLYLITKDQYANSGSYIPSALYLMARKNLEFKFDGGKITVNMITYGNYEYIYSHIDTKTGEITPRDTYGWVGGCVTSSEIKSDDFDLIFLTPDGKKI
jgi:hypothetical protein